LNLVFVFVAVNENHTIVEYFSFYFLADR